MLKTDEDALICDLAQFYHIYDWKSFDLQYIAILACGLPPESRIRKLLTGQNYSPDTIMLASAVDYLAFIAWSKTKDGAKGRNKPKSMVQIFQPKKEQSNKDCRAFNSADDFEKALAEAKGLNNELI